MQPIKMTAKKIVQFTLLLLLLLPIGGLLWVWAALAWIQFRPLPPVPHFGTDYSLVDAGQISDKYLDFYARSSLSCSARLTASGKLIHLDKSAKTKDEFSRKDLGAAEAQKLGLVQRDNDDPVGATANNGNALVRINSTWTLFRNHKAATMILEGVQGYLWKPRPLILGFDVLTTHDEAIGNGRIATGYASSGGLSSPHGRWLPLIWHGKTCPPEDLNSHIDPKSGWYLDRAIDINEHGQILCTARQTDLRGAENYPMEGAHWIIITPSR